MFERSVFTLAGNVPQIKTVKDMKEELLREPLKPLCFIPRVMV